MVKTGQPLEEGDVVLSGVLGPMAPAKPGAALTARIQDAGVGPRQRERQKPGLTMPLLE
jgi:2-keto-4-pentenoate hydratase